MWASKLRTLLTLLGTIIGVFSVVAIVAVIQGLNRYVAQEILGTGSHVFTLTRVGMVTSWEDWLEAQKRRRITLRDAEWLRDRLRNASLVVASLRSMATVKGKREEARGVPIMGTEAGYPGVGTYPLALGRHLDAEDVRGRRMVAVVGWDVRRELLGPGDPIGQWIRIRGHRFRVVGVLRQRGKVLGFSQDNLVVIPATTYQKLFGRRQSVDIAVKARSPELFQEAQDEARLWMRIRRGLRPQEKADFEIVTSEMFYRLYTQATSGLFLGMIIVVSLSLLVGGIVIMNIMLVAVTERTREIGIRRAVGASAGDIVAQFLVEAATLSGLGGLVGVLGGVAVAWILRHATSLPTHVAPGSLLMGLFLAVGVGVVFGLYPAYRASRLDPILALRYEA
jgi:putative ABC transport system permease protein